MKCVVCEERPQGDPHRFAGNWCGVCTRLFKKQDGKDASAWAARRARELEREACAQEALNHRNKKGVRRGSVSIAAAIRARSNKGGG